MTLRLHVTDMRDGSARSYEFDRLPLTIGRIETNRLRLEDTTVSRLHATIDWDDDSGPVLLDLGSRNGTYVKGLKTPAYAIRPLGWVFTFSIGPFVVHGFIEKVEIVSLEAETRALSQQERSRLHPEDSAITVVRRMA